MTEARAAEIAKYKVQYRHPGYRLGDARRAEIVRVLSGLPTKGSLLDVGTGRGETLKMAARLGFEPRGTEVVAYLLVPGVVEYAEAHNLPYADNSFDHVTCFDVLEHLVMDDIRPALLEFARVARHTVTVSAATKSHKINDVELHVSAMPFDAWHELITGTWSAYDAYRYGDGGKSSGCWQMRK